MNDGLDHILFAASDLEQGCDAVEAATGVRPAFGGAHPGRGTCNALASLGPGVYLEVIAPDPAQSVNGDLVQRLRSFAQPALAWWAVRASNLGSVREQLSTRGFGTSEVKQGHRLTDAGVRVEWSALYVTDDRFGAATPFLIDWGTAPQHPSRSAPQVGRLVSFEVALPDPHAFEALAKVIDLGPLVGLGVREAPALTARIERSDGSPIELRTPSEFPPVYPPRP